MQAEHENRQRLHRKEGRREGQRRDDLEKTPSASDLPIFLFNPSASVS
jgi:hypothetical protein